MLKHTYKKIYDMFKDTGCQLLETEEEFKTIVSNSKVRFISKCGHENTVTLTNFIHKKSGALCKDCIKDVIKQKQKEYNQNSEGNTSASLQQEFNGYIQLKEELENVFEIIKTNESCLADFLVKPKECIEDKWLMVQLKTCKDICHNLYSFKFRHKKYYNCSIILYCIKDKKTWLLGNDDIKVKQSLNIGLTEKSEYFKFQVKKEQLTEQLLKCYGKYKHVTEQDGLTPQGKYNKREHKYYEHRENKLPYLQIEYPAEDGTVYDLIINGKKVQDKVAGRPNRRNHFSVHLGKSNGYIDGKQQFQSYQKGDNHFYWIWIDKEYFYLFPENILLRKGYVTHSKDKRYNLVLYPYYKEEELQNIITGWANQYLYHIDKCSPTMFQQLGLLIKMT